ncbi:MAG: dTMP kinase [Candidatus Kapaibacterium sp.]|jgi:dTMP kinase|nr:dTMP kinase [Candidatus Kapabacteria bacterium]
MLITFEGIDGCGKSTQLNIIGDLLENHGYTVHRLREPGGTTLSESIREILLSSKNNINDIAELLLFEAARSNLTENLIKPALANGEFVLCDRFYDSTTAYQGFGRQIDIDVIAACNQIAVGNLKPDLTFYLKISLDSAKKRAGNREQDRIEKAGDDFFSRVINGFDTIAQNEPDRVIIIDSEGSIEETKYKIMREIPIFNDII